MTYKIDEIEGIGPSFADKLMKGEINTTDDLLEKCCTPKGRKTTSETTGIGETHLLKWANMADLMRVSGVGRQYAELLEAAGVDTIKELRNRNAENLFTKMNEINTEKKLSKGAPAQTVVQGWIDQAKTMEPKISY
jgi:predicted flap endonuclease-1-like 5' DNA nuclease